MSNLLNSIEYYFNKNNIEITAYQRGDPRIKLSDVSPSRGLQRGKTQGLPRSSPRASPKRGSSESIEHGVHYIKNKIKRITYFTASKRDGTVRDIVNIDVDTQARTLRARVHEASNFNLKNATYYLIVYTIIRLLMYDDNFKNYKLMMERTRDSRRLSRLSYSKDCTVLNGNVFICSLEDFINEKDIHYELISNPSVSQSPLRMKRVSEKLINIYGL